LKGIRAFKTDFQVAYVAGLHVGAGTLKLSRSLILDEWKQALGVRPSVCVSCHATSCGAHPPVCCLLPPPHMLSLHKVEQRPRPRARRSSLQ